MAALELPSTIPDQGYDVGELRLLPLTVSLVAEGIVVDEEGRGLPGAVVVAMDPISYEREAGGSPCGTRADAEGRFRLFSPILRGGIEIIVRAEGFVRVRRMAVAGAKELRFVLPKGAGLKGSVLFPEGASPEQLCPVLRTPGTPEGKELEFTFDWLGRFRLANLIPGSRNLSIHSGHPAGPVLHRVDGILLEAGTVGRDPRLQAIDLRPLVQPVELEVVDAAGKSAWGVTATVIGKEGTFRATRGSQNGSLSFHLPRGDFEVRVEAGECRPAVIRVPPGKQKVVLEPLP